MGRSRVGNESTRPERSPAPLKPASRHEGADYDSPIANCSRCGKPVLGDLPSLPLGLDDPVELLGALAWHPGCARIIRRERERAKG